MGFCLLCIETKRRNPKPVARTLDGGVLGDGAKLGSRFRGDGWLGLGYGGVVRFLEKSTSSRSTLGNSLLGVDDFRSGNGWRAHVGVSFAEGRLDLGRRSSGTELDLGL